MLLAIPTADRNIHSANIITVKPKMTKSSYQSHKTTCPSEPKVKSLKKTG